MTGQFDQLERELPWLAGYGSDIYHVCNYSGRAIGFFPVRVLTASPRRTEAKLYGFDGPLEERLGRLFAVLARRGWRNFSETPPTGYTPDRESPPPAGPFKLPPPLTAEWRPAEDELSPAGYPMHARSAAGKLHPPGYITLDLGWASRQGSQRPVTDLAAAPDVPAIDQAPPGGHSFSKPISPAGCHGASRARERATIRIIVFYRGEAEARPPLTDQRAGDAPLPRPAILRRGRRPWDWLPS